MFKRVFAIACCVAAFGSAAYATDLPNRREPPPFPKAKAPQYNWTGFHVGVLGGGVRNIGKDSSVSGEDITRGLAGVYAGYDYQASDRIVLGIEGDASLLASLSDDASASTEVCISPSGRAGTPGRSGKCPRGWSNGGVNDFNSFSADLKFRDIETLRLRAGYLVTPNTLLFASGGLAVGHTEVSVTGSAPGPETASDSNSGYSFGWTAGAGLEHRYTSSIQLRLEYLYYDLGDRSASVDGPGVSPQFNYGATADFKGHILRAGLGYSF